MMSAHPEDRLSTADMVSAAQPASRNEPDMDGTPSNVRRMARPPREGAPEPERLASLLPSAEAGSLRHHWEVSRPGSSTSPAGPSRTRTAWSHRP